MYKNLEMVKKSLVEIKDKIESQEGIYVSIDYKLEISGLGAIADVISIRCYKADERDRDLYYIDFVSSSKALMFENWIDEAVEIIKESFKSDTKDEALETFSRLDAIKYRNISLKDEEEFKKRPLEEIGDHMF